MEATWDPGWGVPLHQPGRLPLNFYEKKTNLPSTWEGSRFICVLNTPTQSWLPSYPAQPSRLRECKPAQLLGEPRQVSAPPKATRPAVWAPVSSFPPPQASRGAGWGLVFVFCFVLFPREG